MKKIGYFGVDSGQIIIGDPAYLTRWKDNEPFNAEEKAPYAYSYNGATSATCSKKQAGILGVVPEFGKDGLAVAVATGGDGVFPVYAEYEDGRITQIIIRFDEVN